MATLARSLPRQEREDIVGTMVGLAYNYLEPEFTDQLLGVLQMANALENLIADTLVRGREEGKAEGIAEGLTEGIAAGRRQTILDLLSLRLGPLSETLRAELVPVADDATLGRLLLAASTAASLEEFRHAFRTPNA